MTFLRKTVLFLLLYVQTIIANVEKVIFLGPSRVHIPRQHPTLEDLQLHTLSPQNGIIRTKLRAEFPTNVSTLGEASWVLLANLTENQRYELRICWAATQPTSFQLLTYKISEVFGTSELMTSLATYSQTRQSQTESFEYLIPSISRNFKTSEYGSDHLQSVLLLQILATADYYTTNRTLMDHVPPVFVDIILDPYILNIFPRSLVSTGVHLSIVAISSWFLAKYIAKWLQMIAGMGDQKKNA